MKRKLHNLLFWTVVSIISFCGCSKKLSLNEPPVKPENAIERQLDKLLSAQNPDITDVKTDSGLIEEAIVKNAKYEIVAVNDDGTCTLTVSAPDMTGIIDALIDVNADNFNPEEEAERIRTVMLEILEEGDFNTVTNTVTVPYSGKGDNLELHYSFEFANAVYGGMLSKYDELISERK